MLTLVNKIDSHVLYKVRLSTHAKKVKSSIIYKSIKDPTEALMFADIHQYLPMYRQVKDYALKYSSQFDGKINIIPEMEIIFVYTIRIRDVTPLIRITIF